MIGLRSAYSFFFDQTYNASYVGASWAYITADLATIDCISVPTALSTQVTVSPDNGARAWLVDSGGGATGLTTGDPRTQRVTRRPD